MSPRRSLRNLARYRTLLVYLVLFVIIALPLFGHLDELPIQVWDEMRNAENALEMNRTGRVIITTYDYLPEAWNTKPPLFIWILAISFRLLGNTELALRLPSAIAAMFTCLLLLRFAKRHTGSWMPGILAVFILVTIPGYVVPHGTRTGDYDALLVLCSTAAAFWFFNYLEDSRVRWLYLSAAALTAAVLTKGVAGLFVAPAMLAYALLQRKTMPMFRQRSFYICLLGFVILVGGYYALREIQQPGYVHAVVINELGGRYNALTPGINSSPAWGYFHVLFYTGFAPWAMLLVPAICAGWVVRWPRWRRVSLFCVLLAATVIIILSGATTRAWWYLMPIYPALALLCGMFITQVMMLLSRWSAVRPMWRINFLLPAILLVTLLVPPYKNILERTIDDKSPKMDADIHDAGVYLKEVNRGMRPLGGNVLCGRDPMPLRWYQEVIREKGQQLDVVSVDSLAVGAKVLAWDEETKARIRQQYRQRETEVFRNLTIYMIEGKVSDQQ